MTKLKQRFIALICAIIFTAVIFLSVFFISCLTPNKTVSLSALQLASQNHGTIKLDCTYSENNHTLAVKQTTTYINHSRKKLSEIKFAIHANAYQQNASAPAVNPHEISRAYPNGFDAGWIKVTTPHTIINDIDNTVVTIPLNKNLEPNQTIDLDLEYVIKIPNIKHRLGYTENTVNLGNFYAVPIIFDNEWDIAPYSANGDPFYNEPYNFDVIINVPDGYCIAASAPEIAPHHFQGQMLRDFALVLSRDFQTLSKMVGDTLVTYYYLDDVIPEISLYTACNALAYFSQQFIDYPYPTLSIVQTDFLHGGMEYGALVYIAHDVTDQLEYQNVIVHEIAHQWWYGLIGNDQNRTAWIDEGLAEYSTAVFFETHPQYNRTLDEIATNNKKSIQMFENIMDEYHVSYSRNMNRSTINYDLSSEYTINTYARSMLMFYAITQMVGYQNLNNALAKLANAYIFNFVTPYELCTVLETQLGKDLTKFINNYLAGKQDIML